MSDNMSDDWGRYYAFCPDCGARWHASEGYCSCVDDADEADEADEAVYEANYAEDYADEAEQAEDGGGE